VLPDILVKPNTPTPAPAAPTDPARGPYHGAMDRRDAHNPPRFEAHRLAHGVRYELPARSLGPWRWLGLVPIAFGLLFVLIPLNMARGIVGDLIDAQGSDQIFHLIFLAFISIFFLGAAIPVAIGLAALVGRNAVELRDGRLRSVERIGPFWKTHKRKLKDITRLEVVSVVGKVITPGTDDGGTPNHTPPRHDVAGLRAHGLHAGQEATMLVAWGYPRALMRELADAIATDALPHRPARLFDDEQAEPAIAVVERTVDLKAGKLDGQDPDDLPVTQPAGSRVTCDHHADGLTLTVPPAGLRRGSKGLFGFALLWNGFMAVFTTIMVLAMTGVMEMESNIDNVFGLIGAIAFVGLFWAIGIGLMLGAVNAGRRHAVLDVVGDTLLVYRRSIFGTKQREWNAHDISHIRIGPSGTEVNNRPIMQLQIHPKSGKKYGLLSQTSDDEIRWIAHELRQALRVPASPPPGDDD